MARDDRRGAEAVIDETANAEIEAIRKRREVIRQELSRRSLLQSQIDAEKSVGAVRTRCEESLAAFVMEAWHVLEPEAKYIHSWHIDAVCDHLEAVTDGSITRLLMNIPPGTMKSLLVSVFWPAWEWGPKGMQSMRYIATSFKEDAVLRDNRRMRALVTSQWYQRMWPIKLIREGEISFENSMTGWREGAAFGSLTSKRADRLIIDDPHSVEKAESAVDRQRTVARFREGAFNRLNDQANSAIVVIMQRVNEGDVSGEILDNNLGYEALILPMEYESSRHCETSIGFSDPRSVEGELLCPDRFSAPTIMQMKNESNSYVWAGQYQQRPNPRGGGIFPYNSWEFWTKELAAQYGKNENQFPDFDLVIGSVDSAFTQKKENDFTAMVVLGVWANMEEASQIMVMFAWKERLAFFDAVEKIITTGQKMKIDRLLIESKASGISLSQEIIRLTKEQKFAVQLVNPNPRLGGGPNEDKQARAHSISHLHREEKEPPALPRPGIVYVPTVTQANGAVWPRHWADSLIVEAAKFPKGKHDDLVDAYVQGVRWLRQQGMIRRMSEVQADEYRALMAAPSPPRALYG